MASGKEPQLARSESWVRIPEKVIVGSLVVPAGASHTNLLLVSVTLEGNPTTSHRK